MYVENFIQFDQPSHGFELSLLNLTNMDFRMGAFKDGPNHRKSILFIKVGEKE